VKSYWTLLGVGLKLTFYWQWEPLVSRVRRRSDHSPLKKKIIDLSLSAERQGILNSYQWKI
jgi:hypothetical protein